MAILNPLHALIVPFICVFIVPLAIFAGVTTTLAFSVLMFRVALVYVNIAISLVPQYLMGRNGYRAFPASPRHDSSRDASVPPTPYTMSSGRSNSFLGFKARDRNAREPVSVGLSSGLPVGLNGAGTVRQSRRASQGSAASRGTITPINEVEDGVPTVSPGGLWVLASSGVDRDFEGVGGWRLDDRNDDSDWANINSRLELPLEKLARHHHSSLSADLSAPAEGGWLMMKSPGRDRSPGYSPKEKGGGSKRAVSTPNISRARTSQNAPATTPWEREDGYVDYFTPVTSHRATKKSPDL